MPIIRPSSDLRNSYNEISTICHETNKPIYITKNGAGDLAVMSIELYESLTEKYESYNKLENKVQTKTQPQKEQIERDEINDTNKVARTVKTVNKPVTEDITNIKIDNNYSNRDNKTIKDNHINRENKDTKTYSNNLNRENERTNNIHIKEQKHQSTDNVLKKIDINTKNIKIAEPESAHEILQEIQIEPIIQSTSKEKVTGTGEIFRNLDTELKKVEKKETHVAKAITGNNGTNIKDTKVRDIKNTDWIFEDLNKMLDDIKV